MEFRLLPGTEQEALAVAALLPSATVLTRERATETALKAAVGPRVLHVATHGFFYDQAVVASPGDKTPAVAVENPLLRSGLALAGANRHATGRDDGVVTALEVAGLDLWGTELAVLSACSTGLGEVRSGDGVYGLRRALVLAGAETQVMSLWQVSDRYTRDLMVSYYRGLTAGEGRAEALRKVQLAMLANARTRHPAYWAGFIVSGDWRPLR
jgi:CHAT domain-containing protein